MLVYVLNKHGKPLMPCKPRKARILLRDGKAKVVKKVPFTIQLLYGSSGYTQDVSLGVDAGSKHIGISATTEKEVLFEADVELRNDIVDNLSTRREARRARRNRKTRYRKPRFNNRKKAKKSGWIAPSIRQKIETHLSVVDMITKIIPVTKIIVETASFDIQKIQNPDISGEEYQHTQHSRQNHQKGYLAAAMTTAHFFPIGGFCTTGSLNPPLPFPFLRADGGSLVHRKDSFL